MVAAIGVDTGKRGAVCLVDFDIKRCHFVDVEVDGDNVLTPAFLNQLTGLVEDDWAGPLIIEKVWGMQGQSSKTTFVQGGVYSQLLLALKTQFGPFELVAPVTWKSKLGLKGDKTMTPTQRKKLTLQACRQWFPWADGLHLEKHNDRADALAIAYYGSKFLCTSE